jgi:hypothetical protein
MTAFQKIVSDHLTETADVRVLTKKFGGLLGVEYLIGYGDRYFRCGELSLSLLKRGVSPDELSLLEVEDPDHPGWED